MDQDKNLLSFMMIMLKLDLKLCAEQDREQDLKYLLLNKYFKEYQ